jgi:hypothetical protein
MAHVRRKLFEVFEATRSPIAEEALQRIAALYAIEVEINGKPATLRLTERQARSKPLLDGLHDWLLTQRRRLSSKSILGKAMQYALNRWEALARYLEDGRLSIDTDVFDKRLPRRRPQCVRRGRLCSSDGRSFQPDTKRRYSSSAMFSHSRSLSRVVFRL